MRSAEQRSRRSCRHGGCRSPLFGWSRSPIAITRISRLSWAMAPTSGPLLVISPRRLEPLAMSLSCAVFQSDGSPRRRRFRWMRLSSTSIVWLSPCRCVRSTARWTNFQPSTTSAETARLRCGQRVMLHPGVRARIDRLDEGTVVAAYHARRLVALAKTESGGLRPSRVIHQ
jgi:hypothetical protein